MELIRTELLRDSRDPTRWRIQTWWASRPVLEAMRRAGTPAGVLMFRAAGAEPTLSVYEMVSTLPHEGSPTTQTSRAAGTSPTWEDDIRAREEEARAAFLAADLPALDRLWADGFTVNSPLQQVLGKSQVLALLQAGRIRHNTYEQEIEHIGRHGDVVVVMGHDQVTDPPDGAITRRRYTNVWRLENGVWRSIARHANMVSHEAAG